MEENDKDICLYFNGTFENLCEKHIPEPWEYNIDDLEDYMDDNRESIILIENTGMKGWGQIATEKLFFMKNISIKNEIIRELKHIAKLCEQNNVIGH